MDLNFGVKISRWLLGKPWVCSNGQETALLTTAQNNSNCADLVGKAFEASGACGGVRILRNANIISKKVGESSISKRSERKVIKLSSTLEANMRLNF